MTAVYCFSGTGHSLAVARFFARRLGTDVRPITDVFPAAGTAVVVFPVYCQNIPAPVKEFLGKLDAAYVVLIAVHGGISSGRVLQEAAGLVSGTVIAGASVPAGHTFLREKPSFDADALLPLLARIDRPEPVLLPRTEKIWYASLFPRWRSRMSVRLFCTDSCVGCGVCGQQCPTGAMVQGNPNRNCIRCLHCVTVCPHGALDFRLRPILRQYLARHAGESGKAVLYL